MPSRHELDVDGDAVVAVHHEASGDDWIVFCHGFLGDKSGSYERRCQRAVEEGYDAVRFDFRGRGESGGAFVDQTLASKLADLEVVLAHFDPDSVVLYGSSFGGKVAFHRAVRDERVAAVVTRAPVTYNDAFDDYRAVVEREGALRLDDDARIGEEFFAVFDRYPFADVVDRLAVPVAIVHGEADDVVPVDDSRRAAAALETDVLLRTYAGEGHLFSRTAEERLLEQVFGWLSIQSL